MKTVSLPSIFFFKLSHIQTQCTLAKNLIRRQLHPIGFKIPTTQRYGPGIVPSCSPSIKPCQSGKVSEEKSGLIALCVHFLLWLLSYQEAYKEAYGAIWWSRRLIPRSQDGNTRGHLPIGVNAVIVNHGLQGVQVCWRSMREKEKVTH